MDKKTEIIFRLSSLGFPLNLYNLNRNGINNEDIENLVSNNIIKSLSDTTYQISDIDLYLHYGIKELLMFNYREANMCFKLCYQLAPDNRDVCLQYMLTCLIKGHYERLFSIYDQLVTIEGDKYLLENNIYLYLLSTITKLDDKYSKKSKMIDYKDVMLSIHDENIIDNEIRKAILNNKFTYAFKLVNDSRHQTKEYMIKYELLRFMLNKTIDCERQFKKELFDLACCENYKEIMNILVKRQHQRRLSRLETYIYLITAAIIDLMDNGIIRVPTCDDTDDMLRAIMGNNFELAIKINNKFFNNNGENQSDDTVSLLLLKINSLMNNNVENIEVPKETEEDIIYSNVIREAEELAYYIRSQHMALNTYVKKVGLLQKYALLVKLVYARDYFIYGDYSLGDKMIMEVEMANSSDVIVLRFLNEVKVNRDKYFNTISAYTRKKIPDNM